VREDCSGSTQLFVVDVASGATEQIATPHLGVYRPAWSPDGQWIAFAGVNRSGIYVVRPDGTGLRLLTDSRFFTPDNPEWSTDGTTIAFTANLSDGEVGWMEGWDVYVVGVDGSGLRNVTNTPDPEQSERPIGWLPNGNLLIATGPGTIGGGGPALVQK